VLLRREEYFYTLFWGGGALGILFDTFLICPLVVGWGVFPVMTSVYFLDTASAGAFR
jgi:hypothetical protein